MLIQLDFDGTVVEFDYPKIGLLNEGSIEVVNKLRNAGHEIVLNTYRADLNDGTLEEAHVFLKEIGIFPSHLPIPTNEKKVKSVFNKHKIDCVINLAAQAGVRYSIKYPKKYTCRVEYTLLKIFGFQPL